MDDDRWEVAGKMASSRAVQFLGALLQLRHFPCLIHSLVYYTIWLAVYQSGVQILHAKSRRHGGYEASHTLVCIHITAASYTLCTFNSTSGRRSDTTHLQSTIQSTATNRWKGRFCDCIEMSMFKVKIRR